MAKSSMLTTKLSLSDELAEVVGKTTATRAEVMKKVWAYIKANDLQDEDDKRVIVPDETLAQVIGKKPVNMMKLAGFLSKHME